MLFPVTYWKSTGWTPAQLSPLVWATPRLSVTESSGNVSALPDLSGNGNDLTQLVGSSQPTYNSSNANFNGVATVDFNGTSDFLRNSALSIGIKDCTIFLVYRVTSTAITGDNVFSTETTNKKRLYYSTGTGDNNQGAINNGSFVGLAPYGVLINTTGVLMTQYDGSALRYQANDKVLQEILSYPTSTTTNQIGIGYNIGLNARWIGMELAEVIVFNYALTSDEIDDVRAYLNRIYLLY